MVPGRRAAGWGGVGLAESRRSRRGAISGSLVGQLLNFDSGIDDLGSPGTCRGPSTWRAELLLRPGARFYKYRCAEATLFYVHPFGRGASIRKTWQVF